MREALDDTLLLIVHFTKSKEVLPSEAIVFGLISVWTFGWKGVSVE